MSLTSENNQCRDSSHRQDDRARQFQSKENDRKPLVDMANPVEARFAGEMSHDSGRNGERAFSQSGHLKFDDPYGDCGAANSFPSEHHDPHQSDNMDGEFSWRHNASEEATSQPTDATPSQTATSPTTDATPSGTATSPRTDATPSGGTATTASSGADGSTTGSGSGFQVNDGKITYNGQTLAGVNVSSAYFQEVGAQTVANQLASDFPGINVVRLETSPEGAAFSADGQQTGQTTTELQADIQALNAKGIGVIIDNHAADANNANNVSLDGSEAQWFGTLAQQNLGNNGVMFQPENEPTGSNQAIVSEQVAAYNAIRATGSNNVVAFDLEGGDSAAPQLSDPSAYDSMSNYVIDAHSYVADSQPITDMQSEAVSTASLKEANGQAVPVYFGETGNSIDGTTISTAANQLLQTEFTDGNGAVAFAFDHAAFAGVGGTSQADNMTDPNGNLNTYGQFIASLIQQSSSSANNN